MTQHPTQWFPSPPQVIELQALTRRIEVLEEMLQMEKNRLDVSPLKTKPSINRIIKTFETEIADLKKSIKEHIDNHPDFERTKQIIANHSCHW